ncbi:unnamed protein product [Adineta steineri]|uniref:Uncharacterized protein n=1 Tax=Adineta steineri TaxID=433720 RepID=A0A814PWF5_9BILA|nr:unnamed protein product [Adineta steineri]CAF1111802.1 unnamed protein product [Adineta steineri]CAF3720602.1 unnamed protein product [Adineta steineri]
MLKTLWVIFALLITLAIAHPSYELLSYDINAQKPSVMLPQSADQFTDEHRESVICKHCSNHHQRHKCHTNCANEAESGAKHGSFRLRHRIIEKFNRELSKHH